MAKHGKDTVLGTQEEKLGQISRKKIMAFLWGKTWPALENKKYLNTGAFPEFVFWNPHPSKKAVGAETSQRWLGLSTVLKAFMSRTLCVPYHHSYETLDYKLTINLIFDILILQILLIFVEDFQYWICLVFSGMRSIGTLECVFMV